jgi:hypothetical protein
VPEDPSDDAIRGSRFIRKYDERSHVHRLHPKRLWRLLLGVGLLAFGIVNVFIPGPGGSVMILAALLLLAGESRLLARLLDRSEVRFQRPIGWAVRHKVAAMLVISGCAFAFTLTAGYVLTQVR